MKIPWGAWYAEEELALPFPERWQVDVLSPRGGEPLSASQIQAAIEAPVAGRTLQELAASARTACLVVDDLARPTRASEILPTVLKALHSAGIKDEDIDILVATGSHGSLSRQECSWKLGPAIANRYRVHSHDCRSGLTPTGIAYGDHELSLNSTFLAAELKVAVGSVLPHTFAGFSGGAKLVLPGLADLRSIGRSHKFVQLGLRGGTDPNANGFRTEAEEIARRVGLSFVICAVTNAQRETIGLYAGDVVAAHRAACALAATAFATPVGDDYDCVILNAYPKDLDLIQAANAFVAWKTATRPLLKEDGFVILTTACSQGLGHHGLFEPEGLSYKPPQPLRNLRGRDLWIFAPGVPQASVNSLFWDGYRTFQLRDELLEALNRLFPGDAAIGVFPCAPSQQVLQSN